MSILHFLMWNRPKLVLIFRYFLADVITHSRGFHNEAKSYQFFSRTSQVTFSYCDLNSFITGILHLGFPGSTVPFTFSTLVNHVHDMLV